MPPRKRKSKAAAEAAQKRPRRSKPKPIPLNLYALQPFGCNTVKTEVIDSAFHTTTTTTTSNLPNFEAAFLTSSHLYTIFKTVTSNGDNNTDNNHSEKHQLQLARMCRQTHVWSACPAFPPLNLNLLCDPLQQAVYLPWSHQLVLFFLTTVAVVDLVDDNSANTTTTNSTTTSSVQYLSLETMVLDVTAEDQHPVTVRIPRLYAEWHAVTVDPEERLLYVQATLSMLGDFVPRELGVYRLNVAGQRFARLVLLETERKSLKPALFMAVVKTANGNDDDKSKTGGKMLYIGAKEVHTVYGRTGLKLPNRELISLNAIIHINLSDLNDWGITSLSTTETAHQPLQRQIRICATSTGNDNTVYLMTATGGKNCEHVLAGNRLWELKLKLPDMHNSNNSIFPLRRLVGPQEQRCAEPPVSDFTFATACNELWVLCKSDPGVKQAGLSNSSRLTNEELAQQTSSRSCSNQSHSEGISEMQQATAEKKQICLYRIPLQLGSLKSLAQEAFLHYRPPVGLIQKSRQQNTDMSPLSNDFSAKKQLTLDYIQTFLKSNEVSLQHFDLPVKQQE